MNLKEFLKPTRLTWKIFAILAILLILVLSFANSTEIFGIIFMILFYVPIFLLPKSIQEFLLTCVDCGWGFPGLTILGWIVAVIINGLFLYFISLVVSKIIQRFRNKNSFTNSIN